MSVIVPTITVETAEKYKAAVDTLQAFASRVHIDLMDGEFAPVVSVAPNTLYWPTNWQVDIHAMVARPADHLPAILALKPSLVILHAEVADVLTYLQQIKAAGIKAGLALQKQTVPATMADAIRLVDHVMIFSGDLGHYGGTASLMQLEKVRLIKALNPNVEIGWDGGVTVENAYTLTQGGVGVLNVGAAIAESTNPADSYNKLVAETQKHGVL